MLTCVTPCSETICTEMREPEPDEMFRLVFCRLPVEIEADSGTLTVRSAQPSPRLFSGVLKPRPAMSLGVGPAAQPERRLGRR